MVWVGAGCGCGLDRVWIGLDPGLDRPRSGLTLFVYVAAWMQHGKKRTTRCAGSKCAAWLLGRLALQLATVSAWQFDSLGATVAAWLLDCLTA